MPSLSWTIAGAIIGWWIEVLFWRQWRPQGAAAPARDAEPDGGLLNGFLLGALLGWLANRETPPRPDANPDQSSSGSPELAPSREGPPPLPPQPVLDDARRLRIARGVFAAAVFVVGMLAAGQFFDWFPAGFYKAKGFLLSNAALGLMFGGVAGVWASHYRAAIRGHAGDFYEALLGTETKSSWALQSAVAIVGLLLIVLAIKPDLLDQIESFRAGEVEAKFSTVSSAARETARIGLSDIAQDVTIGQWIDFKANFLEGPRADALEFDTSKIKDQRTSIRNILFAYIEPVAILLDCVKKNDRIDEVKRSEHLTKLALSFRNMVLQQHDGGPIGITSEAEWQKLLELLTGEIAVLSGFLDDRIPDSEQRKCKKYDEGNPSPSKKAAPPTVTEQQLANIVAIKETIKANVLAGTIKDDVKKLSDLIAKAIDGLKQSTEESRYKLSYIDPYVIGAVSDLVALTLGNNEKANFLTLVKDKYPTEMKYIQPGLINLYYQLGDAKVRIERPWPLDDEIAELDQAQHGVDYLIAKAREARDAPNADKAKYQDIVDTYFMNKIIVVNRYLEIYMQRSLGGQEIAQADRRTWIRYYRYGEGILATNTVGARLLLGEIDEYALPRADLAGLRRALITLEASRPQFIYDLRTSMGLSSIMLSEKRGRAPAQACALGKYYMLSAKDTIPSMITANNFDQSDAARLRGYLQQLQARIDVSC